MADKITYYDVDGLNVRVFGEFGPMAKMEAHKGGEWVPFIGYGRIMEQGYEVDAEWVEQSIEDLKAHHEAMKKRGSNESE